MQDTGPKMRHLQRREDFVGNLYLIGDQFERAEDGTRGWHIVAWWGAEPERAYWVEDGRFHGIGTGEYFLGSDRNVFEIGNIAPVSDERQNAVLGVIGSWSQPEQSIATAVGA